MRKTIIEKDWEKMIYELEKIVQTIEQMRKIIVKTRKNWENLRSVSEKRKSGEKTLKDLLKWCYCKFKYYKL